MADEFIPVGGVSEHALAEAVMLASLADETPEGRSIVALAMSRYGLNAPDIGADARIVPFSAHTRISGVDLARARRCARARSIPSSPMRVDQ